MEHLAEDGRGSVARARGDATPPATSRLTLRPSRNRRVKSEARRKLDMRALADACGRALRRSLTAIIAVLVVGAIGGTAWAGYRFVTTSSRFAVTTIEIHGTQRLDADELRASLPVHVGDNVFTAPIDDLVAQLRANPWIESADARRVLPHAIVVELRERTAVAVVELDGGRYLADANGRAFKRAAADEIADLPLVTGITRARFLADPDASARAVQGALAALAMWRKNAERPSIVELHVDPRGTLALVSDAGIAIELGRIDDALATRLAAFDAAWSALGDDARSRAAQIRVRADRATVAFSSH